MSKLEISSSLLKPENKMPQKTGNYNCLRCGNEFEKPIFAVNNSPGIMEIYSACPFCLSKIKSPKEESITEASAQEEPPAVEEKNVEIPKKIESPPTVCPYHVGYLKKRPKNTPVPEECFTCVEMIDCMSR